MFLYPKDIIPSALIQIIESETAPSISYVQIMQYGETVMRELKKRGIPTIFIADRDSTYAFEVDYQDVIDVYEQEGISYIKLKDGKTLEDLRNHSAGAQTFDKVMAMTSQDSREALGIKSLVKTKDMSYKAKMI